MCLAFVTMLGGEPASLTLFSTSLVIFYSENEILSLLDVGVNIVEVFREVRQPIEH